MPGGLGPGEGRGAGVGGGWTLRGPDGRTYGRSFVRSLVRTDGRTDGRTEIPPSVLQDIVPFGSAAQKALEAHEHIDFDQTTCLNSFYIFQSFSPYPNYKITNSFERSEIHLKDRKFISKIANSFPRLQTHFQDCKFTSKIANSFPRLQVHFHDCKFIYKIEIHL